MRFYVVAPKRWDFWHFTGVCTADPSFFFYSQMRLVIKENYDLLCEYVANYVIDRINKFNPTPEKPFVLGRIRFMV